MQEPDEALRRTQPPSARSVPTAIRRKNRAQTSPDGLVGVRRLHQTTGSGTKAALVDPLATMVALGAIGSGTGVRRTTRCPTRTGGGRGSDSRTLSRSRQVRDRSTWRPIAVADRCCQRGVEGRQPRRRAAGASAAKPRADDERRPVRGDGDQPRARARLRRCRSQGFALEGSARSQGRARAPSGSGARPCARSRSGSGARPCARSRSGSGARPVLGLAQGLALGRCSVSLRVWPLGRCSVSVRVGRSPSGWLPRSGSATGTAARPAGVSRSVRSRPAAPRSREAHRGSR